MKLGNDVYSGIKDAMLGYLRLATKGVQHQGLLRDRLADITESVGQSLQLVTVLSECHVALVKSSKFSFNKNRAAQLVVKEQVFNLRPDDTSRLLWFHNDIEDFLRYGWSRRAKTRRGSLVFSTQRQQAVLVAGCH